MTPEPPEDWIDDVSGPRPDPEAVRQLRRPGRLTDPERRRLETELALNELLDGWRPPPLSSNFTARVLAEVARESRTEPPAEPWWRRLRWVPRAVAFAALAIVGVVIWNSGNATHRARLAQGAMELGTAATVPGIEAATLADFEVIRHMTATPRPEDDALILALAE
jgi:anti-sigma factor RsiW